MFVKWCDDPSVCDMCSPVAMMLRVRRGSEFEVMIAHGSLACQEVNYS